LVAEVTCGRIGKVMRVALFNTFTPFVRGGAEILVDDLMDQLKKNGHEVDLFKIPFPNNFELPLQQTILSARMLRFDQYDILITFKFPAYSAKHPRKVMWMFHQFRQVYELFGEQYGLNDDDLGNAIRSIIMRADQKDISDAYCIFTNAQEVTNRLWNYNQIASEVLNPPLKEYHNYYCGKTGDYIYYPSRITNIKRQHLAVEAMRYVKTDVKLIISGKCDEPGYVEELTRVVKKYGLEKKVTLINEWLEDDIKIDYVANSLALLYIPYKEDSCGFVSMEAFYSSKPVITCHDSGGTIELIDHKRTGLFSESSPKELAKAMDELFMDKDATKRMGEDARVEIIKREYTWERTIRRLLL
jgi:glycosyltransferase involved in cell wall biosynthesis